MVEKADYELGDALWELIQRISRLSNQYFNEFSLGQSQFSSLLIIGENEGISIIKLSKIQIIEKSTAGKTIQKLEKKGLVIRKQNLNDKREFNLFLTTKGKKILPRLYRTYDKILNIIFADIKTVEKEQYFQITKKINEILSK